MISGKTASDIFEQIRSSVQSGGYLPGDTLPPVRELALELNINRNTVAAAYKRLIESGIAESRGRNGTVIRPFTRNAPQEGTPPDLALTDLAGGNPSLALLPDMQAAFAAIRTGARLYGEPAVSPEIERYGRSWLGQDITTDFALSLSSGAVDAVERILSSYLIGGDKIAVEDPCFISSINTLNCNRLHAVGVAIDEEGMCAEALSAVLAAGVQAVIITPRAHNPTGWGLSPARAAAIRTILQANPNVLVIIDDHFSLLSTGDYHHVIPPETRRWALVRSVSKFLGPDMRLAFIASDKETSQRLGQRLNAGTNWVSHILQDIVASALQSSAVHQAIRHAKEQYRQRRQYLLQALAARGVSLSSRHDGLNLWVPLKEESSAVIMALAKQGWLVRGGEVFGVGKAGHGLRITVSELSDQEADAFAEALAGLLAS